MTSYLAVLVFGGASVGLAVGGKGGSGGFYLAFGGLRLVLPRCCGAQCMGTYLDVRGLRGVLRISL